MILQGIPETMPAEHYRPINIHGILNLYLFLVFTVLLFAFGLYFIIISRKQEVDSAKRIKLSLGLFGIFWGITRIFFILMFQDFTNPEQNYDLIANIAYAFGVTGFLFLIWSLEKAKYEKKYFFTVGLIITIITIAGIPLFLLGLANIRETILLVITLGMPIAGFFIIILYLQLIRQASGIVKKKAGYSLLGFVIMILGITLDGQAMLANPLIPLWVKMDIVPIICIIGLLIFVRNQM